MARVKILTIVLLALVASLAISETFACRDLIQAIRRQRLRRILQSDPDFIQEFGITNPNGQNSFQGSSNQGFMNQNQQQTPNQQQQQLLPSNQQTSNQLQQQQQQQQSPSNPMQQGTQTNMGNQQTSSNQQQVPGQQQSSTTLQRRNST